MKDENADCLTVNLTSTNTQVIHDNIEKIEDFNFNLVNIND